MLLVKDNDYLEVSINSLIADYDRETLTNLYQPIIGYKSIALYFTLLSESNNQKINPIISHESLFLRMKMNVGEFIDARKMLEGVGLLKTYVQELKDNKIYEYELYAPKTPKLFFDNTLLYGLLIKALGEAEASKMKNIYLLNSQIDGNEITASFGEVFAPDLDDPAFRKALEGGEGTIGRQTARMISDFKYETFFETLKEISQIKEESFSKKTMKEIERLAMLYGVNESRAAEIVAALYNPKASKENRIDFTELAKAFMDEANYFYLLNNRNRKTSGEISSDTDLARKINLMERKPPKEYLMILQNGSAPAESDLKILNDLSSKFKLPNSVINAVIDYVLSVNDNVLSKAFTEKIAGSLAREGVQTSIDAMNYLKKIHQKNKGRKKKEKEPETPSNTTSEVIEESGEDTSALDWDEMIKKLEEGYDDGQD